MFSVGKKLVHETNIQVFVRRKVVNTAGEKSAHVLKLQAF